MLLCENKSAKYCEEGMKCAQAYYDYFVYSELATTSKLPESNY